MQSTASPANQGMTYPLSTVPGALGSSRPRYHLLDGLRGVAAMFVIWYHFFEGFATSPVDQMLNHGYLAVDFFFILSGFVIGYAYDQRWKKGMTFGNFFLRRVIRLHPMVIFSVVFGAIAYLIQGSVRWDGTPMPLSMLLLSLLLGLFLIPAIPGTGADVRGNNEMFPLNGPSWSLFFEYIGSILYGIWLHRLSVKGLRAVVAVSALCVAGVSLGNMSGDYHLGVGWSLSDYGFFGGFFRMSFSFALGLLMSRTHRPMKIRGAFWICTAILAIVLPMPYIGATSMPWLNACYDLLCLFIVFPAVVYIGASGQTTDPTSTGICNFLGELSYPVYIIHYPIMYLFYAWVWANSLSFGQVWPVCTGLFVGIILLAWAVLRLYDAPVRRWLTGRFLSKKSA